MNTIELRNSLINKISQIENIDLLQALQTILETKSTAYDAHYLEEYNLDILQAEKDIAGNKTTSHEQVLNKIEQWKKR